MGSAKYLSGTAWESSFCCLSILSAPVWPSKCVLCHSSVMENPHSHTYTGSLLPRSSMYLHWFLHQLFFKKFLIAIFQFTDICNWPSGASWWKRVGGKRVVCELRGLHHPGRASFPTELHLAVLLTPLCCCLPMSLISLLSSNPVGKGVFLLHGKADDWAEMSPCTFSCLGPQRWQVCFSHAQASMEDLPLTLTAKGCLQCRHSWHVLTAKPRAKEGLPPLYL